MRLHVHTTRSRSAAAVVTIAGFLAVATPPWARAETPAPGEAWRTSPFHKVPNAATGNPIPCVCVFRGRQYRVGEAVCMTTHVGTVIARCDLSLNNTTWAPTTEPCTVSRWLAPTGAPAEQSRPSPHG